MQCVNRILRRIRQYIAPPPGKRGSSLGLVVIIGAALIIWSVGILPMMMGTDKTAMNVQQSQKDYLTSRSAIEFCKSELNYIVGEEKDIPYTFAVIKQDDGTFTVVKKKNSGGGVDTNYGNFVNYNAGDDKLDVPQGNAVGKQVAAICAVTGPNGNIYDITITTFHRGIKDLTYAAVYKLSGSLLIYPESYKQSQALPLSDFVLVDGKLGSNTIWNSTIAGKADTSFTETLLPLISGDPFYANAGEYPVLFKQTALAPAGGGGAGGGGSYDFTDETLKKPFFVLNSSTGAVTVDGSTSGVTAYYNGVPTMPVKPGVYAVTASYNGSSSYVKVQCAPVGEYTIPLNATTQTLTKGSVTVEGNTVTVTAATVNGKGKLMYGVSTDRTGREINWQESNVFTGLDISAVHYFYYGYTGSFDGTIKYAPDVAYAGMAFPTNPVSSLISGEKYLIAASYGGGYHALMSDGGSQQVIYPSLMLPNSNFQWTATSDGDKWKFSNNGNYLRVICTAEWNWDRSSFKYKANWTYGLQIDSSDSNNTLSVSFTDASVYIDASARYWVSSSTTTGYLQYNGSWEAGNASSAPIYFVHIPNEGNTTNANMPAVAAVNGNTSPEVDYGATGVSVKPAGVTTLYANGVNITDSAAKLAAGKYQLIGTDAAGSIVYEAALTVRKAAQSAPSLNVSVSGNTITLSNSRWNGNGGYRYFGYAVGTSADYNWFVTTGNSIELCLPYGTYTFIAEEGGTVNHAAAQSATKTVNVAPQDGRTGYTLTASAMYFMGKTNSIKADSTVHLTTDLLVLAQPVTGSGSVYVYPYNTDAEAPGDVLVFFVNDCGSFKEKNFYRIPNGTDINHVSAEDADAWWVTEYAADGTRVGTDIVRDPATNKIESIDFVNQVKHYFRNNIYPTVNLDIAYASEKQLLSIVSGETIGWTNNGKLVAGTDDQSTIQSNAKYVVCAFINQDVTGTVSRSANRVLIAAKRNDLGYTLQVGGNLSFTTRYLSIDAENLVEKTGSATFKIYNLGQNEHFFSWLDDILHITPYISKTLQVDYERATNILYADGSSALIKTKIYRYDSETDLFAHDANQQELLVTYSVNEIKNMFGSWGSIVQTVDRYITLTDVDSDGDGTLDNDGRLDIGSLASSSLKMFANYIYVDGSVDKITISTLFGNSSDIIINSQENGYTNEEYMGLFSSNSAESYSGTLLYFKENVEVSIKGWLGLSQQNYTIQQGFYRVPATERGTSLSELASNSANYRVDQESLKNSAVYVDPDTGELSNAYVDTGIYTDDGLGGGFFGGAVQ